MTPFSLMYHSEHLNHLEKDYIDNYSIQVLDFN